MPSRNGFVCLRKPFPSHWKGLVCLMKPFTSQMKGLVCLMKPFPSQTKGLVCLMKPFTSHMKGLICLMKPLLSHMKGLVCLMKPLPSHMKGFVCLIKHLLSLVNGLPGLAAASRLRWKANWLISERLIELLQKLAHYLEVIADGNEAALLSTGYDLSHIPAHRGAKTEAGGPGQS